MTEDRPDDIRWMFGRTDKRPGTSPLGSHLRGNVLDGISKRIKAKTSKRYGKRTALVIRDTSGVDWEWESVADDVQQKLGDRANPYDMGIWVLNRMKTRLSRLS